MNVTSSFVLPYELRTKIKSLAEEADMSSSKYVKNVLIKHVEGLKKKKKKT